MNKLCRSKSCAVCRCDEKDIPQNWMRTDKVDESNTSNSTNDDIEDLEDGDIDGYKLINEANERRILNQKKQVKASINISEKYDILKKISRTNTSSSVDHSKRASISKVCTLSTCFLEANEHMLTCKECKRPTHYACTKLPGYQLALFTLKSYRIFKCKDCSPIFLVLNI